MKRKPGSAAFLMIIILLVIGIAAGAKKWKEYPQTFGNYSRALLKAGGLTLVALWGARAFLLARFAAAAWIGPASLAIAAAIFVATGGWNVFAAGTGAPQVKLPGGGSPSSPITSREACERAGGIWHEGPDGRGCLRVGGG